MTVSNKSMDNKETISSDMLSVSSYSNDLQLSLNEILATVVYKPSVLSHLASFFSKIPWWIRLLLGALLIPIIVLGFIAQLPVVATVIIALAIVYSISCFLLANHHKNCELNISKGREAIYDLGSLLTNFIGMLDQLHFQLEHSIEKIEDENSELLQINQELRDELNRLGIANEKFNESNSKLQKVISQLENDANQLNLQLQTQKTHFMDLQSSAKQDANQLNNQLIILQAKYESSRCRLQLQMNHSTQMQAKFDLLLEQYFLGLQKEEEISSESNDWIKSSFENIGKHLVSMNENISSCLKDMNYYFKELEIQQTNNGVFEKLLNEKFLVGDPEHPLHTNKTLFFKVPENEKTIESRIPILHSAQLTSA